MPIAIDRRRFLIGSGAASLALCAMPQAFASLGLGRIIIGTNPAGTNYYTIGGGMAKAMSETLMVQTIIQPYTGASIYLPLVETGEVTLGFSNSVDAGLAFLGDGQRAPMPGLRTLAKMWELRYGYLARGDSGIESIADARGKRVITRYKANVSLDGVHDTMLAAAGLSPDDVDAIEVGGPARGIEMLIDGSADVVPFAFGTAAVREADARAPGGVRFLSVEGDLATDATFAERVPGTRLVTVVPGPNAAAVVADTTIVGLDVYMLIAPTVADADAGAIAGALVEIWPGLQEIYPPLRQTAPDALGGGGNLVPYHPGAAAYYREHGMLADTALVAGE